LAVTNLLLKPASDPSGQDTIGGTGHQPAGRGQPRLGPGPAGDAPPGPGYHHRTRCGQGREPPRTARVRRPCPG
jgi:hypothetical protein